MHDLNLTLRTDRPDARYRRGEPIAFQPELAAAGAILRQGIIDYQVFHDTDVPVESGTLDLAAERPFISAALNVPGFVQCQAVLRQPAEALPVSAALGAAVEPEAIRPGAPRPADFDEFWQARLAELAAIPAEPRLQPIACDYTDLYDIRVKCLGAPVSGYFAKPCGPAGKLPALLHLQGAGVKSAFLDPPLLWAARGYLALCINAHGLPNGQPADFYNDLAVGGLADYRHRGLEHRDTYYMLGMFLRVKRAMDFLTARPEWDGRNLLLLGHSQGAFQAIAGAYLDTRVSALAAGVPAGCDLAGESAGRCGGWPKIASACGAPGRDRQKIMSTAPYFDNANFLAAAQCPAIFSVGWIDKTCRPSSVYAAINNFQGDKTILDRPGMGHAAPGDVRAAFAGFLSAQPSRAAAP